MPVKKPAALFDFDGTITRRDTFGTFLLFVLRRFPGGMIELPRLVVLLGPHGLGLVSKERMKGAALRIVRRVPPGRRPELIRQFHDSEIIPRYLTRGIERIRWHQQQGHTLVLASASVDVYLGEVARHLGFDLLVCTRATLEPEPAILGPNCYGAEKVNRLRALEFFEQTDWRESYAYSDHPSDLPMMRLCGHPVAANPKPALRSLAEKDGWEIVDWR